VGKLKSEKYILSLSPELVKHLSAYEFPYPYDGLETVISFPSGPDDRGL
jgi:hypothetical protein